jgi:hypothetical protein
MKSVDASEFIMYLRSDEECYLYTASIAMNMLPVCEVFTVIMLLSRTNKITMFEAKIKWLFIP